MPVSDLGAVLDGHSGVGVPRGASQGGRLRLWESEAVCAPGRTVGQGQGCVGFQEPGLCAGESEGKEMKERGELSCCFDEGR